MRWVKSMRIFRNKSSQRATQSAVTTSRRKRILFRGLAVLLGISPFLVAELICSALDVGDPSLRPDPFVGFVSKRPLFRLSEDETRYEIAANRFLCFQPDSFLKQKPRNGYRIFCLGGSTVQGRPYSTETSFTTWWQLSLEEADSDWAFEVVNCGGISYASYRLTVILEEVLNYDPDLILIYTGHNEYLEDRSYADVKHRSRWLGWLLEIANRSRLYTLVSQRWYDESIAGSVEADDVSRKRGPNNSSRPVERDRRFDVLPTEVHTRLDYEGGLARFQRDDDWRQGVAEHFEFNLRAMAAKCRQAAVPVWFVDPVCNLSDCRPFKSLPRSDIRPDERRRWKQLRDEASNAFRANPNQAIKHLEEACQIDGRHAGLVYDLAESYALVGRYGDAKRCYQTAIDEDVCPLRMTTDLRTHLTSVVRDMDVPLIAVRQYFERESPHEIPGGNLLVDHVHPSIIGHQMIDKLLMDQCFQQQIVRRSSDWDERRTARHAAHLESLGDKYYLKGQVRLESLRNWAQGRATETNAEANLEASTIE